MRGKVTDLLAESLRARGAICLEDFTRRERTRQYFHRLLTLTRETGGEASIGHALTTPVLPALAKGDYAQAETLLHEGIALQRKTASKDLLAYSLRLLSKAVLHQGDRDCASTYCRESLALNIEVQSKIGIAACLALFAGIALAGGRQSIKSSTCDICLFNEPSGVTLVLTPVATQGSRSVVSQFAGLVSATQRRG